jgi:pimeloyl-ACP methyl ester carboxylesterase
VVSTFTRLRDVARAHYGPLAWLAADRFDSLARVSGLRVPFFAAHGEQDDIVPFALGRKLAAAAPEPKHFLALPGRGHNDVLGDPALLDAVAAFAPAAVSRR